MYIEIIGNLIVYLNGGGRYIDHRHGKHRYVDHTFLLSSGPVCSRHLHSPTRNNASTFNCEATNLF